MWRGGSRKWNEWKAVRERRRQEGKRERGLGREEKENALEGKRERLCDVF